MLWTLGTVLALCLFRHGPQLVTTDVLIDEQYYVAAADAVLQGVDPASVPGWFYPTPAAWIFAGGKWLLGERGMLLVLRALNTVGVVGLFATAGCAVAQGFRRTGLAPLCAAGLFLEWETGGVFGYGNVSALLNLFILLAVLSPARWWRVALLSAGFVFKPFALGLVLSRPVREAALPLAIAAVMVLGFTAVGTDGLKGPLHHGLNLSPWRLWVGLWGIPAPLVFASMALLALTWARGQVGRALCLGWALLPVAWPHSSTILLLPWAFAARHQLASWGPGRTRVPVIALAVAFAGVRGPTPVAQWLRHLPVEVGMQLAAAVAPVSVLVIALLVTDPPWAMRPGPVDELG